MLQPKYLNLDLWAAECSADLILGINRCLEIAFPKISKIFFHNNRVYIWIILCNLYGLYWLLFRHPYIFNGINFEFFFDPLIGYEDFRTELFKDDLKIFTIHNTMLAIGSPLIYLIFSLFVFFKARELINSISKEEKMVKIKYSIYSNNYPLHNYSSTSKYWITSVYKICVHITH
uniref:Uncharacterized protein n=1 Tax=Meloidogyne enterolobii TaxID=390850 RepID=A0A6V7TPW7_MELEN|nr:unnamed protein product [Meloidogyne enterolobii]